jgi:rhamnosyltransferase
MSSGTSAVWAVVVTHNPQKNTFLGLLDAALPQIDGMVVVDNGSTAETLGWLSSVQTSERLRLIGLPRNRGIAAAQNAGIAYLRKHQRADYVILFDHDSVPAPDMVARLLDVAVSKRAQGVEVAAVGPRYLDDRQDNPPPFIRLQGIQVRRQACRRANSVVEVSYLIASGCLIPMDVLRQVGAMKEELFIDYVDIEWGLRARRRGFHSFGACGARMAHELGDPPIRFLGRNVPLHSPLRHYYHFRNAVWLYRKGRIPWQWKLADGWRLTLKYGFYTLFARPRHKHWWMMTKGVCHGLCDRMGPYR